MMKRLIAALLSALCLSALPLTALGSAVTQIKVVLPYYHVWKTDVANADDRFTYRWTAVTEDAPMPAGTTEKYWDWNLRGNTSGKLSLTFSFTEPGSYSYRLAAYVPTPKKGYVYEPRSFLLTVLVKNDSGGGLRAEWVLLNELSGEKVDRIDLDPSYTENNKSGSGGSSKTKKKGRGYGYGNGSGGSSGSGSSGRTAKSVKTGDETRIHSMVVILSVCGVLMAYLVYEELRERKARKK